MKCPKCERDFPILDVECVENNEIIMTLICGHKLNRKGELVN